MSTHPIATPDKKKSRNKDTRPSSFESQHSAKAVSPGAGFSDTQLAQLQDLIRDAMNPLQDLIRDAMNPIRDDLRGIDNRLSAVEANMNDELRAINKRLSSLETNLDILVKEHERKWGACQCGEDSSQEGDSFCLGSSTQKDQRLESEELQENGLSVVFVHHVI